MITTHFDVPGRRGGMASAAMANSSDEGAFDSAVDAHLAPERREIANVLRSRPALPIEALLLG